MMELYAKKSHLSLCKQLSYSKYLKLLGEDLIKLLHFCMKKNMPLQHPPNSLK